MVSTAQACDDRLLHDTVDAPVFDQLNVVVTARLLDAKKHSTLTLIPGGMMPPLAAPHPIGGALIPALHGPHIFRVIAAMTVWTLYLGARSPVTTVAAADAGTSAQSVISRLSKR